MKDLARLNYCEETRLKVRELEGSFLVLGERLKKIRDEKLFIGQWETFEEYLEDVKLTAPTASKLINVYQKFLVEWQFRQEKLMEAGGWSVLYPILRIATSKEEAEEWVDKACVLSRKDLEKEITEAKTGIDMSKCKHHDTYVLKVCRTCGHKEKVLDDQEG